jgi:hypothetical protein
MKEVNVVDKCLAFCQVLAMSNHKFTFNLNISTDNFNFDNKELVTSSWEKKKKKSPSQLKREASRREERKQKSASGNATEIVTVKPKETFDLHPKSDIDPEEALKVSDAFDCDQCDYKASCEAGLKRHMEEKHRMIPQLDGNGTLSSTPKNTPECSFCKEVFNTPEQLFQHILTTCSESMKTQLFAIGYGQILEERGLKAAIKLAVGEHKLL